MSASLTDLKKKTATELTEIGRELELDGLGPQLYRRFVLCLKTVREPPREQQRRTRDGDRCRDQPELESGPGLVGLHSRCR